VTEPVGPAGPAGPAPDRKGESGVPSPGRTLRRLFLTLFLRGRTSRGLKKEKAPKGIGSKLGLTLGFYALFGLVSLYFIGLPVFALALYLNGMTLILVGMTVAASAGEMLFNKEEADILLHRPIDPKDLLWAKVTVLVQMSLWMAGAFNLAGIVVGVFASDGGLTFPLAHIVATTLEALFCTGCVVLVYELVLRWFGRERLDALMTSTQVIMSIAVVTAGQVVPRLFAGIGGVAAIKLDMWWMKLLPPAWFAGFDDALSGSGAGSSWLLGALGVGATSLVVWLAFGKLAGDYATGLRALGETVSRRPRRATRRWIDVLVGIPPLRWWLRDSISRAAFLLTGAYLLRDREMKLRVYPGLAPMLVLPIISMARGAMGSGTSTMGPVLAVAFSSSYLAFVPLTAIAMVERSQQWQAADLFRIAPIPGPAPLSSGARRAVLFFLTLPLMLFLAATVYVLRRDGSLLLMLLPGAIALPLFALVPCLGGKGVPLAQATEEGKAARSGCLIMSAVMLSSFGVSGLAAWAWTGHWLLWMIAAELVIVGGLYAWARASINAAPWPSIE
jgi:hypothetical protein